MKLKNSYILLIAIAILALISIGSVCAEDSTSQVDIISDDGSDIVLSDSQTDATNNDTAPEKIKTSVESENTIIKENEAVNIPVTVKDNATNTLEITKDNITVFEGNKSLNFNYNNSKIIISDKLARGNHSLIINYLGNNQYANSSTNIILGIFGNYTLNTPSSINVNSTKKAIVEIAVSNGIENINIDKNNLKITSSYKDGNDTKTNEITDFEIVDGKLVLNWTIDKSGDLIINYNDGSNNLTKTVSIKKIINGRIIALNTTAEYASGSFRFQLIDADTNEPLANRSVKLTIVTGSVNTGITGKTNDEGIVTFDNTQIGLYSMTNNTFTMSYHIPVGTQKITVEDDDSVVVSPTLTTNVTITKATVNIKADNFKDVYGTKNNFTINVTNKNTGNPMKYVILKIHMPETSGKYYYVQTNNQGIGIISVGNLLSGTYNTTVSINDTKNINSASVDRKIIISQKAVKITTSSVTVSFNTGSTATIKVTDKATGKAVSGVYVLVQLYTGSKHKDYLFQTNDKGVISFSASLGVGKHKMVVSTADNRYLGSTVTKYITVTKATGKLSAPKVTAYYKQGKYFTIKLINSKNKKAIYDAKVNIKVYISKTSYYNYNGNTGANGQIKLLINYKPGTYKVVISAGESKNYTAKKITSKIVVKKAPTKLTPTKLTAKKGASKYFKVKVTNKKTKKIIKGVKVKIKVYTGKKYKTYTVKTNSKGIAQLNVKSLKVGTHKVVITSANKYCPATAAKSTIKITKK